MIDESTSSNESESVHSTSREQTELNHSSRDRQNNPEGSRNLEQLVTDIEQFVHQIEKDFLQLMRAAHPSRGWHICGPSAYCMAHILAQRFDLPIGQNIQGPHIELDVKIYTPKDTRKSVDEETFVKVVLPPNNILYVDPIYNNLLQQSDGKPSMTVEVATLSMQNFDQELETHYDIQDVDFANKAHQQVLGISDRTDSASWIVNPEIVGFMTKNRKPTESTETPESLAQKKHVFDTYIRALNLPHIDDEFLTHGVPIGPGMDDRIILSRQKEAIKQIIQHFVKPSVETPQLIREILLQIYKPIYETLLKNKENLLRRVRYEEQERMVRYLFNEKISSDQLKTQLVNPPQYLSNEDVENLKIILDNISKANTYYWKKKQTWANGQPVYKANALWEEYMSDV